MPAQGWAGGCDCCCPFPRGLGSLLPNTAKLEWTKHWLRQETNCQGLEQVGTSLGGAERLWG